MRTKQGSRYHVCARILRWLMAFGILFMWASGQVMMVGLEDGSAEEEALTALHASVGIMLLLSLLIRISLRLIVPPPPLPDTIPAFDQYNARMGHFIIYVFMILIMLSGLVLALSQDAGLNWFGLSLVTQTVISGLENEFVENFHFILATLFFFAILIHVAAVLKHRWFEGEDIFYRMWFGKKPTGR